MVMGMPAGGRSMPKLESDDGGLGAAHDTGGAPDSRQCSAALRIAELRRQGRLLLSMVEAAASRRQRRMLALRAFELAQQAEVMAEEARRSGPAYWRGRPGELRQHGSPGPKGELPGAGSAWIDAEPSGSRRR